MAITAVLLGRTLGAKGFGQVSLINNTIALFGGFALFGIGTTLTTRTAQLRNSNHKLLGQTLGLGTAGLWVTGMLAGGALAISARSIAAGLHAPELEWPIRLSALTVIFSAVLGAPVATLTGFEAFSRLTVAGVVAALLGIPLILLGAYWGGVVGTVLGYALLAISSWMLHQWMARRHLVERGITASFNPTAEQLRSFLSVNVPVFLSGVMNAGGVWISGVFLTMHPASYVEVGVFGAATQWRALVLFLPATLSQALLPVLASSQEEPVRRAQLYESVSLLLTLVTAAVAALAVSALAPFLMASYGQTFGGGAGALVVLGWSAVFMSAGTVIWQALLSRGVPWQAFLLAASWFGVQTAAAFLLYGYGASGMAYANLISFGFQAALGSVLLWRLRRQSRRPAS